MRAEHRRALQLLAGVLATLSCQRDRFLEPEDHLPDHSEFDAIAVRVEVDVARGTVRVLHPAARDSGGPSLAILGSNEIGISTGNLVRSAPINNKVTVTFDAALTNRLTSSSLVPSSWPASTAATGILLFPFRVSQVVGGTPAQVIAGNDWNGDGTAGSGAPRNFFNDSGCGTSGITSDCFRWEQYPAPLGPGETTPAQKVGFVLPKAITSFQVLLVLAANISNDLPAVASIAVTPSSDVMDDGFPAGFSAMAYDAANQPLPWARLTWTTADITALEFQSGGSLVGTITGASQVVHGRKVGQTSFSVSSGGVSVVVPVDIKVNTVALVQLMTPDSSLTVGDQVQGDARVKDHSGGIIPGLLPTWGTTDPRVITVDQNGLVSAVGAGTAIVYATAGIQSASVTITVAVPSLGTLSGYVRILWGNWPPLDGATVTVVLGGLTFSTTSDGTGHYTFPSLPVGQYSISGIHPSCLRAFPGTITVTQGQTTTVDLGLDCPPVVNGRVVEVYGGPLPPNLSFHLYGFFHSVIVPVQPDGSFSAVLSYGTCGSYCEPDRVYPSIGVLPAGCSLFWGPLDFQISHPAGVYNLQDFVLNCSGEGTIVVDLTLTGNPPAGQISLALIGPAGPHSQFHYIYSSVAGALPFLPMPPGDYVVDTSYLPPGCSIIGPAFHQVTLAQGATEHVSLTVDCP